MSMFKKILTIVIIAALMTTLFAACGAAKQADQPASTVAETKADTASSETKPAEKKTIVLYSEDDFIKDSYADYYKEFEDTNNATVKRILVPKDKYVQTFMVTVNGGQQVDVLVMNGQDVRAFSKKGLIMDMTDLVTYWDRFVDSSLATYTFGDKKYAVPFMGGPSSGVYYNKEILDKYGLQPPKTFADLVAINKAVSKDGISTFAFGGASKYMWPMWYFDCLAQSSGGKSVERTVDALQGKAKWTEADFVEAMKMLENLGKANLYQKGFNGAEQAQGNAVFTSGKAALFFGGTWEIDGFRKAGMTGDKLGMVSFPVMKDGAVSQQTGAGSTGGISLYSKLAPENKDLALKLVDYLTSDKKALEIQKLSNAGTTPNKNVKIDGVDPLFSGVIASDLIPSTVTFLDWIWAPEITKEFQDGIQAVVGGKITAEAEMARVQKVFDDITAKGYDFNSVK